MVGCSLPRPVSCSMDRDTWTNLTQRSMPHIVPNTLRRSLDHYPSTVNSNSRRIALFPTPNASSEILFRRHGLPLTPRRATGYLTGNQQKQTEGNLENERAQWEYKQATSEGLAAVPIPSVEGVKGKVESVVGMVTGDQERQREGNVKAEKAAWTEGV